MSQTTVVGIIGTGINWSTNNWQDMRKAHSPELEGYVPGTLNINLGRDFPPPDDEAHSLNANRQGLARDIGFLRTGNYIHPAMTVVSINGHLVDGRVYYPGGVRQDKFIWPSRNRLEVLARVRIREALGLRDGDKVEVMLTIAG